MNHWEKEELIASLGRVVDAAEECVESMKAVQKANAAALKTTRNIERLLRESAERMAKEAE